MTCDTVSWFNIDALGHQDADVEDDMQDKLTGNSVKCQLTHLFTLSFYAPSNLDVKL